MPVETFPENLVWMKSYIIQKDLFITCFADTCERNCRNEYPRSKVEGTEENLVASVEEYRKTTQATIIYCTSPIPPHIRRVMPVHATCSQYSPKLISK